MNKISVFFVLFVVLIIYSFQTAQPLPFSQIFDPNFKYHNVKSETIMMTMFDSRTEPPQAIETIKLVSDFDAGGNLLSAKMYDLNGGATYTRIVSNNLDSGELTICTYKTKEPDNFLVRKIIYKYNNLRQITEVADTKYFMSGSSYSEQTKYYYSGSILIKSDIIYDSFTNTSIFLYDDNPLMLNKVICTRSGENWHLLNEIKCNYDGKSHLTSYEQTGKAWAFNERRLYSYFENGYISKIEIYRDFLKNSNYRLNETDEYQLTYY